MRVFPSILLLNVLAIFFGCNSKKSEVMWVRSLPAIGSQSSPRASDLNNDGVLDIVMGAGRNEYQSSPQGIIAIDGKTGELLWQQEATDQVYGSATFLDINSDQVEDVFIGGRSPSFRALDGRTGKIIWQYNYEDFKNDPVMQYARYNFNNSVLIPDQNGDGLKDLVTTNGGNSKAIPGSEENRFPGVLILFDSKTGAIISADTMPDGKETYISPVVYAKSKGEDPMIVFGTGGETISGNLYVAALSDLVSKKLSNAKIIATENGHGFIAPPSIADLNKDGVPDIVAISHKSAVFAINGIDFRILWERRLENTESSNSMAVGFFTSDDIPDVFTFVSKGEWPNSTGSVQVMLDGKNGAVEFLDSMGCTGFSSPVIYDLTHDGRDEAIISINDFNCLNGFTEKTISSIENKLVAIDFSSHQVYPIDGGRGFKNIFSTPWIGDLDDDGYLDLIHCQYFSHGGLLTFLGMNIKRINLNIRIDQPIKWGAYMGSSGDGVFHDDQRVLF